MKIKVLLLTCCILALFNANGFAGDIEQGTVSVAVASNLFFTQTDSTDDYNSKAIFFNAQTGYFLAKNFEIGLGFQIDFEEDDDEDSQSQSFMCFMGYHYSLTEKSNLFARIGGGMGSGETKYDYSDGDAEMDVENVNFFGEIGYEFFITKNAALDLSLLTKRSWTDYDADTELSSTKHGNTTNYVTTQLKFKLYF